ncbi:aliphatic nitrilase [Xenorhabdus japonica]|uniref:Aliphatic nitrilase n=1 Tax=Xenorhabdus japonica TaxID=53341 RepID=A0A1I5C5X2_9GAMM|nr:aliphatic nitrilase [Xenorhabdus japonica]
MNRIIKAAAVQCSPVLYSQAATVKKSVALFLSLENEE